MNVTLTLCKRYASVNQLDQQHVLQILWDMYRLTDKILAKYAIQERANTIISDDIDLLNMGLPYEVEKNYGISMQVVRSSELERWVKRNT